jgi:hypothetical protein
MLRVDLAQAALPRACRWGPVTGTRHRTSLTDAPVDAFPLACGCPRMGWSNEARLDYSSRR